MEDLPTDEIHKTIRSLVDITLCAICLETVRPDMVQCINGHVICSECKADLEECPTCRSEFTNVKPSGLISQIVGALPPRCKFKNCGKYLKGNDEDHEKFCGLKPTGCKMEECQWNGPRQNILQHVKDQHPNGPIFNDDSVESHLAVFNNFDVNENKNYVAAFSVQGQFFWHQMVNDVDKKHLVSSFTPITNGKPKNDFFVKIVSASCNDMKFMFKIKLNLDPDVSIENENYISLPKYMLPHFIDNDNRFTLKVSLKSK